MARVNLWKNKLVMLLVKAFRPTRAPSESIQRILVVSTTALGDTLWATPTLSNLRKTFPQARMAVLTSPIGEQVLRHNPDIDQIYLFQEPLSWRFFSLLKTLKKERFDLALILHSSQRLILPLLALSGIPRLIGTEKLNKGLDALLTDPVPQQEEHELERRERIAQVLGVTPQRKTLCYFVQPKERRQADQWLGTKQGSRILFHLGAREAFRRFPSFAAVGNALQARGSYELFLSGSSSELSLLQEVHRDLPSARLITQPMRSFAALLEQMDLILCTDTGPLHLACALNRPVIALFASSDPKRFGPYHVPQAKVIARPLTCNPCLKRGCHEPFCYLQIALEEVIEACEAALSATTLLHKSENLNTESTEEKLYDDQ